MNLLSSFIDWLIADPTNAEETMSTPAGLLLLALITALAVTGCNALGTAASFTGQGCIKVKNYTSDAYVIHSESGKSVKPLKAQYQETNNHPVYTGGENYAETDLSVMVVELSSNETVNSHKEEVRFRVRDIGCPIVQISNPDNIRFDIE